MLIMKGANDMAGRLFVVFCRVKTGKKDRSGEPETKLRSCRAYEDHSDAVKFLESVNHDPKYTIIRDGSELMERFQRHGIIPEDDELDESKIFRKGDPRIEAEFARRRSLGRPVNSITEG